MAVEQLFQSFQSVHLGMRCEEGEEVQAQVKMHLVKQQVAEKKKKSKEFQQHCGT